jgi:hypothetical protein
MPHLQSRSGEIVSPRYHSLGQRSAYSGFRRVAFAVVTLIVLALSIPCRASTTSAFFGDIDKLLVWALAWIEVDSVRSSLSADSINTEAFDIVKAAMPPASRLAVDTYRARDRSWLAERQLTIFLHISIVASPDSTSDRDSILGAVAVRLERGEHNPRPLAFLTPPVAFVSSADPAVLHSRLSAAMQSVLLKTIRPFTDRNP